MNSESTDDASDQRLIVVTFYELGMRLEKSIICLFYLLSIKFTICCNKNCDFTQKAKGGLALTKTVSVVPFIFAVNRRESL